MKNYRSIGKIVSSFGLKGELILQHQLGKKTSLKGLEVLFIEQHKDEMLPYFIMSTRVKSETEIYLFLEGVDVKEKTKGLLQNRHGFQKKTLKNMPANLLPFLSLDFISSTRKRISEKFWK